MPDISMCKEDKCPRAVKCYRYRAIPDDYWQAYIRFGENHDYESCEYFLDLREGDRITPWKS